ncbi:hypothetical protein [Promicromonospora soli]|uniref:Glycosyl hydrolase family 39 n=1 Tax=Promicromonospora soli TaxID=2035533 RepID=A0A919KY77_9MICO|nr:hypothetical protein [Promicromonospora soli]GHH77068.1 hypothetical protein GCM10017772_37110 [Promicromonospora soli]
MKRALPALPKRALSRASILALVLGATLVSPAGPAHAAGNTLTVDVGTVVRPVTHVGSGGLYGVGSDTKPTTDQLLPLSPNGFTQPAPGTTHLGNGATEPCCDALHVADNITRAGAQQFIRMPDIYPSFPYRWQGWADWEQKVRTMVQARLAATSTTNIRGWELWNEPDWTWDTAAAGSFNSGWTRTFNVIRSLDSVTPIVGPSDAVYNHDRMLSFLTNARNTNTLPDVIVWHELDDMNWNAFDDHVADYRAIESSLGISPRPIAINEYNSFNQMDIPSVAVHWISVLERHGARGRRTARTGSRPARSTACSRSAASRPPRTGPTAGTARWRATSCAPHRRAGSMAWRRTTRAARSSTSSSAGTAATTACGSTGWDRSARRSR